MMELLKPGEKDKMNIELKYYKDGIDASEAKIISLKKQIEMLKFFKQYHPQSELLKNNIKHCNELIKFYEEYLQKCKSKKDIVI